jgi:hypothetical protein
MTAESWFDVNVMRTDMMLALEMGETVNGTTD